MFILLIKALLIFISIFAFIIGFLLLVNPRTVLKISEFFNMIYDVDREVVKYRFGFGVSTLLISIFFFLMAYYYNISIS